MHTPAQTTKAVIAALAGELARDGFGLVRGRTLLRARSPVATDWIGVGASVRDRNGPVLLSFGVGVHCAPLHKLENEVRGTKYDRTTATFTVNLGYLRPAHSWLEWACARSGPQEPIAKEIATALRTYAPPFWERFGDLPAIASGCKEYGHADYNALRLPILAHLQGQSALASQQLGDALTALGSRTDLAAAELRRAAGHLRSIFGTPVERFGAA